LISLTQRRNRFREFENRKLRTIYGLKKENIARDWRKLHDEELQNIIIMVVRSRCEG
jgi:uncharacterized protein YcaQ